MLRFDDSMLDVHKIFQILMNCLYKQLLACVTARDFANSVQSPVKSLFCSDNIELSEWQDLVP